MRISLVERTGRLNDAAKEYAKDKASKLIKFYDRLQGVEIIIGHESRRFHVEMVARTDHRETIVASEAHEDLYASVDLVMDKMGRQLVRHKEKLRNRKHPPDS